VRLGPRPERRRRLTAAIRRYAPGAVAMLLVWNILARLQLFGDLRFGDGWWLFEGIRRHGTGGIVGRLDDGAPGHPHRNVGDAMRAFYRRVRRRGPLRHRAYAAFDAVTAAAIGLGAVLVGDDLALLPPRGPAHHPRGGAAAEQPEYVPLLRRRAAPLSARCARAGVLWIGLRRCGHAHCAGLFVVAAIVAASANLHRLWWELVPDQRLRASWIWPRTEIIRWIRDRPRDALICVVAPDDNPGITGPNPLRPEWLWLVQGWRVRSSPSLDGCLPSSGTPELARYVVFALAQAPVDPLAMLRRAYPDARERAPIEVPHHEFVARTFDTG
jgi:hypothetical protein